MAKGRQDRTSTSGATWKFSGAPLFVCPYAVCQLGLLCLDELNYVHVDPPGAELLFQVLTEREERASIAVASNAPFSE